MRKVICLFLFLTLVSGVTAQPASVGRAQELAKRLSASQVLPSNVQLRFQVLGYEMGLFSGKKDVSDLLNFFSDSRVMFWNRPVDASTGETMRALEQQVVALAKGRGYNLDLPPVGYAPQSATTFRIISSERLTKGGFVNLILQTEEIATALLPGSTSAELLFLRDSLTRLREDASDGSVSSDVVRGALGSRARFLASDSEGLSDPNLMQRLDTLAEALRGSFTPERLRESRGQELSL